jgi:hypothetical protein
MKSATRKFSCTESSARHMTIYLLLSVGNSEDDPYCPNWSIPPTLSIACNAHILCIQALRFQPYASYLCFLWVGWDWVHLVRRRLIGLWYQPRMTDDDECGAVGGMRIGRGSRSTRRKPAPVPFCPPQIPHDLTWARTRVAAVGSQRLTAWAMARPLFQGLVGLGNRTPYRGVLQVSV